jgi:hypothetical protein
VSNTGGIVDPVHRTKFLATALIARRKFFFDWLERFWLWFVLHVRHGTLPERLKSYSEIFACLSGI